MKFNRLTGEFLDPKTEAAFRTSVAETEITRLRFLLIVSLVAAPAFLTAVVMKHGWDTNVSAVFETRTVVFVFHAWLLYALAKPTISARRDVFAILFLGSTFLSYLVAILLDDTPRAALIVTPLGVLIIAIVMGIGRTFQFAIAGAVFMAVYSIAYATRPGVTDVEGFAYITLSAFAVLISLYIKRQLDESQRRAWRQNDLLQETIQELQEARNAAETANKAKSRFLANMSHEIRTPLNGVLGMAQALAMGEMRPDQKEKVDAIVESGESLLTILNDLLDISKIESGKVELAPIETDLRLGLSRMLNLWKPMAEEKGLAFTITVDEDVPELLVFDAVRIRQCATNLISNAIKFTSTGSIAVHASARSVSSDDVEVVVAVSDTGIGMTQETLAKLFQPFQQADASITREFGGTGLGLAIARELAQLSGGDVTLESKPDVGTVATLSFLAKSASQEAPNNQSPKTGVVRQSAARMLIGKKVLVVDDNRLNRDLAGMLLSKLECDIVEASNGREALEILECGGIDLMLLDIHMPVMDGREVIRTIRTSTKPYSDLPVIALTADAMRGEREALLALGMSGYVSKPIDNVQLATEIRRVISASSEAARVTELRNVG